MKIPKEFSLQVLQYPIKVKLQKINDERGSYVFSRDCETVLYISDILNDEEKKKCEESCKPELSCIEKCMKRSKFSLQYQAVESILYICWT